MGVVQRLRPLYDVAALPRYFPTMVFFRQALMTSLERAW